jgi:hypothetical protein
MSIAELEATVRRYCEMVDVMAGPGLSDYQALYDKVKAEQALYIQLKWSIESVDPKGYLEKTAAIRYRFKLAHARMRALDEGFKERGIHLHGPDERSPCIQLVVPMKNPQPLHSVCCVVS